MKNSNKKFKKALMYFEKGNLEEALIICEKILEKDYSNEDVLALEGDILCLIGKLDEAKVTWKINADYNNNENAKNHLNNLDDYHTSMVLYNEALKDINTNKFEQAREKLSQCTKNNFNKVNISKAIDICKNNKNIITSTDKISNKIDEISIKKTNKNNDNNLTKKDSNNNENSSTITSKEMLDLISDKKEKVESIPIHTINLKASDQQATPKASMNTTEDFVKIAIPKKGLKVSGIVVGVGVIILVGLYSILNNLNVTSASPDKVVESSTSNNLKKEEVKTQTKVEITVDLAKELNAAVSNENLEKIYTLLSKNPKDKVPANDIEIYEKAEELMKTNGVKAFYLKGCELFKEKKYEEALSDFKKALPYSDGNYLNSHIIYFMATSYDNLKNVDESTKYYKMYLDKYSTDTYAAECYYKLALLYKDTDKELSKQYASRIEDEFPDTIYYNDSIKSIIYN